MYGSQSWHKICFCTSIKCIHCINYWFIHLYYSKSAKACKEKLRIQWYVCISPKNTFVNHISAIYKKDYKKDVANCRPISLLHLDYKIYTNSYESNAKNILLL